MKGKIAIILPNKKLFNFYKEREDIAFCYIDHLKFNDKGKIISLLVEFGNSW